MGRGALIAVAVVCCWGCGDTPAPSEPFAQLGPVITDAPRDGLGEMGIEGQLELVGNCLVLGDAIPIFGNGTTWDAATQSVVNPDGSAVVVGQLVATGGEGRAIAELASGKDAAAACGAAVGTDQAMLIGPVSGLAEARLADAERLPDPVIRATIETASAAPLTLTVNEVSNCLYADAGADGFGTVVFPAATTWDPVARAVVNPTGVALSLGAPVAASGVAMRNTDLGDVLDPDSIARLQGCDIVIRTGLVFVLTALDPPA